MSDSRKRHLGSETGRGNVVFADGHWEFIGRSMVLIPALTDPRVRKELAQTP
jgi:prepilin-type processing-associated H-X9-DG protein